MIGEVLWQLACVLAAGVILGLLVAWLMGPRDR